MVYKLSFSDFLSSLTPPLSFSLSLSLFLSCVSSHSVLLPPPIIPLLHSSPPSLSESASQTLIKSVSLSIWFQSSSSHSSFFHFFCHFPPSLSFPFTLSLTCICSISASR